MRCSCCFALTEGVMAKANTLIHLRASHTVPPIINDATQLKQTKINLTGQEREREREKARERQTEKTGRTWSKLDADSSSMQWFSRCCVYNSSIYFSPCGDSGAAASHSFHFCKLMWDTLSLTGFSSSLLFFGEINHNLTCVTHQLMVKSSTEVFGMV